MCTNEILSIPLVANLMERDHNKNSPSDEDEDGGGNGENTPLKALIGSFEDAVVSSSFPVAPSAIDIPPPSPQETSGRKRGRVEEHGGESSSGGGQKGKKKGELTDLPSTDPKCATCGKTFGSWKAVFGHLRSHPERDYRGAFPPPKIWEEMLQQEATRRQHGPGQGSSTTAMEGLIGSDVEGTIVMSSGRGIGIDLNDPEEPHKDEFPFDLNMPAPVSEEEDDNDES